MHRAPTPTLIASSRRPAHRTRRYQSFDGSRTSNCPEERQPNQHAAVLLPGHKVQLIKVATLRELPVSGSQCEEFRQACIETAGCYKSPEAAEAELVALEDKLLLEARQTITVAAAPQNGEMTGPTKTHVPIWTRTSAPGRNDRGANAQRGGSKQAL